MFLNFLRFFKNSQNRLGAQVSRLNSPDDPEFVESTGISGSFEPTLQTALLDGEADWDLPEGLDEMTVISPSGELGGMRHAQLSDKFVGVVVKRLSAVETDQSKSHQHEFNGSAPLRRLLGEADRKHIPAHFVRLDGSSDSAAVAGELSWYDARRKHPTRTEYRLYYYGNEVTNSMTAGDIFFLAMGRDGSALVIAITPDNPIKDQLFWLFGLEDTFDAAFTFHAVTAGRVLKWASSEMETAID
jgi:hypothetical protein